MNLIIFYRTIVIINDELWINFESKPTKLITEKMTTSSSRNSALGTRYFFLYLSSINLAINFYLSVCNKPIICTFAKKTHECKKSHRDRGSMLGLTVVYVVWDAGEFGDTGVCFSFNHRRLDRKRSAGDGSGVTCHVVLFGSHLIESLGEHRYECGGRDYGWRWTHGAFDVAFFGRPYVRLIG